MRVLIADNDPWIRLLIRHYVSDVAECEEAGTGPKAFAKLDAALTAGVPFDVCFLEVDLPEMDGHDVLSALRELERITEVPPERAAHIIMVASEADSESIFSAFACGCESYLEKPITLSKLRWHWSQLGDSHDAALSDTIVDERIWEAARRAPLPRADASGSLSMPSMKKFVHR